MTLKETLHRTFFWDSDFEKLDLKKHRKNMIERVLDRASQWILFIKMIEYKRREEVRGLIQDLHYLSDPSIRFIVIITSTSHERN